jgi:hypothetical protein
LRQNRQNTQNDLARLFWPIFWHSVFGRNANRRFFHSRRNAVWHCIFPLLRFGAIFVESFPLISPHPLLIIPCPHPHLSHHSFSNIISIFQNHELQQQEHLSTRAKQEDDLQGRKFYSFSRVVLYSSFRLQRMDILPRAHFLKRAGIVTRSPR